MTVIAALRHNGTTYLAADTQCVDGVGRIWPDVRKLQTIWLTSGLVAITGSAGHRGIRSLLRRHLTDSGDPGKHPSLDHWAQHIADTISAAAGEPGPKLRDDAGHLDGATLLAYGPHCWAISDGAADPIHTVATLGSGGDLALGALAAIQPQISSGAISPADALRTAVHIAGTYDNCCSTTAVVMDSTGARDTFG